MVEVSKYQSVDEAVKWSVNVLKATLKEVWQYYKEDTTGKPPGHTSSIYAAGLYAFEENKETHFKNFAERLGKNLVNELDKKISSNKKTLQRIRDFRKKKHDDYNSVDLRKILSATAKELGFISELSDFVFVWEGSIVTPTRFVGKSAFDELGNVTYDFGQNIKTLQKHILKGAQR